MWHAYFRTEVQNSCMDGGASICGYVQRRFRALYGPHYASDRNTILNTHRKFMETGPMMDRPRSGRPRVGRVRRILQLSGRLLISIRKASAEMNINATSIQEILLRELRLFPTRSRLSKSLNHKTTTAAWKYVKLCWIISRETLPSWSRCGSATKLSSTFLVVLIGIIPAYGDFAIPCKSTSTKGICLS